MKIIKVEDCTQCKYDEIITECYGDFKKSHYCFLLSKLKELKTYPKIPEWCPLEDYKK